MNFNLVYEVMNILKQDVHALKFEESRKFTNQDNLSIRLSSLSIIL